MTLRGMIRIALLGFAIGVAIGIAEHTARSQGVPQVSIDPRISKDTIVKVEPTGRKPLLFGFSQQVVDSAGLPQTAPRRSYCVLAQRRHDDQVGDVIAVLAVVSAAEAELPACRPEHVPLVIRPTCELSFAEHVLWVAQRVRPVILFCGVPPEVYLLASEPKAEAKTQ